MDSNDIRNRQAERYLVFLKKANFSDVTSDVNSDSFSSKTVRQCTQLLLCKIGSRQTGQTSLPKISDQWPLILPDLNCLDYHVCEGKQCYRLITSASQNRKQLSNWKKCCSQSETPYLRNRSTLAKLWRNFESDWRHVLQLGVDTLNIFSDWDIVNYEFVTFSDIIWIIHLLVHF